MTYAQYSDRIIEFTILGLLAFIALTILVGVADTSLAISGGGQLAAIQTGLNRTVAELLVFFIGGTGVLVTALWACMPRR